MLRGALFLSLLALSPLRASPTAEAGRLPVEEFASGEFGRLSRAAGIAQDRSGVLYVGKYEQVIAFDGQSSRAIPAAIGAVDSLAVDADDRIWIGGSGEFGSLEEDGRGGRVFKSLREAVPLEERNFGQFYEIEATPHGVYFFNDYNFVRWHAGQITVRRDRRGIPHAQDGLVFAADRQGVLHSFDGQTWREFAVLPDLGRQPITGIVRVAENTWVIAAGGGLWRVRDGHVERFPTDIDALLRGGDHRLARLRDGTLVVGPWTGGLALLDAEGRLLHLLTADAAGRPLAIVRGLFQDRAGDLWATFAAAVMRISWPPAATTFDFGRGVPRATLKRMHRLDGRLYVGTAQGLHMLEPAEVGAGVEPAGARFVPVPGCEEQVWDFDVLGDGFVLSGPSVRLVRPGEPPQRLLPGEFTTAVLVPPGRTDCVLVGSATGLRWLRRRGGEWEFEPFVPKINAPVHRLRLADDDLWIGSNNGGYRRVPGFAAIVAGAAAAQVEHYPGGHGFAVERLTGFPKMAVIGGDAWFAERDAVYRFDRDARLFVPQFTLPAASDGPAFEAIEMTEGNGAFWIQAQQPDTARRLGRGAHFVWRAGKGIAALPQTLLARSGSAQAFWSDETGDGSTIWIGGDDGIVRAELPAAQVAPTSSRVVLRRAFDHAGTPLPLIANGSLKLPAEKAALTVEFSTDQLDDSGSRFQTRLEGRDVEWSAWGRTPAFTASDLGPGRYRLMIRAQDRDARLSAPASFAFTVLPAWWQTWWARAGYGLMGVGAIAGFIRWRLRAVQRRNEELEALIDTRTGELRDAKLVAESASRAKSAFLANMSHELRTPLNAILGYAQILGRETGLSDKGRHQLGIVGRNGEHLLQMINEVLDLAKIEAGKMAAHETTFPLTRVAKTAADLFEQRAADKGLAFRLDLGAGLPKHVSSDEQKLRQVLYNLLGNAVKFTERGEVVLAVRRLNGHVRFEVSDTGPGIAPEELRAIFDPFHQATSAALVQGTGLGLPISQRIVELLGGTIRVESEVGRGSRFWFDLALPEVAPPVAPPATLRIITGYRGPRRRLLIADDEATNRAVLRDLLEPLGFLVEEVGDGAACLAAVERRACDLLLLDLRMPVLGGLDTVPRLRALPRGRTLPIVAVSASVLDFNQGEAIAAGCDDFLAKPVQGTKLLETIGRWLHLEWEFRETAAPFEVAADAGQVPLPATLAALAEAARPGDIRAVRALLAAALKRGEPGGIFLRELDELARAFKIAEIRQRLARLNSSASPPA